MILEKFTCVVCMEDIEGEYLEDTGGCPHFTCPTCKNSTCEGCVEQMGGDNIFRIQNGTDFIKGKCPVCKQMDWKFYFNDEILWWFKNKEGGSGCVECKKSDVSCDSIDKDYITITKTCKWYSEILLKDWFWFRSCDEDCKNPRCGLCVFRKLKYGNFSKS